MRTRQVLLVLLILLTSPTVNADHTAGLLPRPDIPPPSTPVPTERAVSFAEVRADPNAHQGRRITVGGEVLDARRFEDTTQIEVLQLPLSRTQEPQRDRTASQGSFLAFQTNGLDPAALPPRSLVTVIGEIAGSVVAEMNQRPYIYPVIEIKTLIVWPEKAEAVPPPSASLSGTDSTSRPSSSMEGDYLTLYWDPFDRCWYWRPLWFFPWRVHPLFFIPHVKVHVPNQPPMQSLQGQFVLSPRIPQVVSPKFQGLQGSPLSKPPPSSSPPATPSSVKTVTPSVGKPLALHPERPPQRRGQVEAPPLAGPPAQSFSATPQIQGRTAGPVLRLTPPRFSRR